MPLPLWTAAIADNEKLKEHLENLVLALKAGDASILTERSSLKELGQQAAHFFPFPSAKASYEVDKDERNAELLRVISILEHVYELSELLTTRSKLDEMPVQLAAELYVLHSIVTAPVNLDASAEGLANPTVQNALQWCQFPAQSSTLASRTFSELQRHLHAADASEAGGRADRSVSKLVCGVLSREFSRIGDSIASKAPWLLAAFANIYRSRTPKHDWNVAELALAVATRCLDETDERFKLLGVAIFDSLLHDAANHADSSLVRIADLCAIGYADVMFNALVQLVPKVNSSFEHKLCGTLLRAASDSLRRCILVFESQTNPQVVLELLGASSTAEVSESRNSVTLHDSKAKRSLERALGELLSNMFFETSVLQTECVAQCVQRFVERFGANCMPHGNELVDTVVCALKTSARVSTNARLTVALLALLAAYIRRCSFAARYLHTEKLVAILVEVLMHNESLLHLERVGERLETASGRNSGQLQKESLEQVEQLALQCFDALLLDDEQETRLAGSNRVQEVVRQLRVAEQFNDIYYQYRSVRHLVDRVCKPSSPSPSP